MSGGEVFGAIIREQQITLYERDAGLYHAPAQQGCKSTQQTYPLIVVQELSPKKVLKERSLRWNLHRRSFMMSRSSPSIVQVWGRNKRQSESSGTARLEYFLSSVF